MLFTVVYYSKTESGRRFLDSTPEIVLGILSVLQKLLSNAWLYRIPEILELLPRKAATLFFNSSTNEIQQYLIYTL